MVDVIAQDFFTEVPGGIDPWTDAPTTVQRFNDALVQKLRVGRLEGRTDLEASIALARLAHDELTAYGTDGGEALNDEQMSQVLAALRAVLKRLAVDFEPPFRNFTTFRSYWSRNGAYGSWQARRDLVEKLFEPLHTRLIRMEERTFDQLADPVTPHADLGWPRVDEEILELRRRFQTASTPQDYRALGTNCVGVLEALSHTVYDPERHLREGEEVPPVDKTKMRIQRFVDDAVPGRQNAEVRALVSKAVDLAQHVKHWPTSRRDAGISADSVILLANLLRRLDQDI